MNVKERLRTPKQIKAVKKHAEARKQTVAGGPRREKPSRRTVVVLAGLLGSMSLTSMLLLVLAKGPLPADPRSVVLLQAVDSQLSDQQIFQTARPLEAGRWRYIYIHHSATRRGNALSLGPQRREMGDHFLIGNGDGCPDGEIQVGRRWVQQLRGEPDGAELADDCISICLVGDFDHAAPTSAQLLQLQNLVQILRQRLLIPHDRVLMYQQSGQGGVGSQFPGVALSRNLLP
jgi:hypothetical protein